MEPLSSNDLLLHLYQKRGLPLSERGDMSKEWTNEDKYQAIELLTQGHDYKTIASKLERTIRSVKCFLNKNGYKSSPYAISSVRKFSCIKCGTEFKDFESTNRKYCSRSCSAASNNVLIKTRYVNGKCKQCQIEIHGRQIYCSKACHKVFLQEKRINDGTANFGTVRKYLLRLERKCNICNLYEWNSKPIPLELDHIDGNYQNNALTNVRLICRNCHAQTSNFGIKNIGHGRFQRVKRYHEGKSR